MELIRITAINSNKMLCRKTVASRGHGYLEKIDINQDFWMFRIGVTSK